MNRLARIDNVWTNNWAQESTGSTDTQAHVPDHSGHQLSDKQKDDCKCANNTNLPHQGEDLQHDQILWEKQTRHLLLRLSISSRDATERSDLQELVSKSGVRPRWTSLCQTADRVEAIGPPAPKWPHMQNRRWLLRWSSWSRCFHSGYWYWARGHKTLRWCTSCKNPKIQLNLQDHCWPFKALYLNTLNFTLLNNKSWFTIEEILKQ